MKFLNDKNSDFPGTFQVNVGCKITNFEYCDIGVREKLKFILISIKKGILK